MIARIPKTQRYRLTDFGLHTAMPARAWADIFCRGLGMTLPAASPVLTHPAQLDQLTAQINAWSITLNCCMKLDSSLFSQGV
jgi:hypothetical protein